MSEINNFQYSLALLDEVLRSLNLDYSIIGGLAVIAHGHDRATQDIDALVMDVDERIETIIQAFEFIGFKSRTASPKEFAQKFRMILLTTPDGTDIDISMGMLPFEREVIKNSSNEKIFSKKSVPIASVEDLIIMKIIAGRRRDTDDALALLEIDPNVNKTRIAQVVSEFASLADDPEIEVRLRALINESAD